MLESIYNIGGGKQQSPLARYLASVGGAAGGANLRGQTATGSSATAEAAAARPQANPDGSFSPSPPGTANSAAGQGQADEPLGPSLPSQTVDYSTDPVLQQMLAGGAQDEATADAQALAARRSVLGQYGDVNLASSVLGAGDPTLGSISDNPDTSTSTLARLKRSYADTVKQSEDDMNAGNLFYSGARTKKLGDLAKDEQTQQADANSAVNDALNQIGGSLASQKAGIRNARAQAEADAANRAAEAAMIAALSGGGGTGAGTAPAAPVDVPTPNATASDGGTGIPSTPGTGGGAIVNPGGIGTVTGAASGLGSILNDPGFQDLLRKLGYA